MLIAIPRADLLRMLATCHPFATNKSAMPMLGNVLLTAQGSTLVMRSTDLYVTAEDAAPAVVGRPGVVAVDANRLAWLTHALPGETVEIRHTAKQGTSIVTPDGAMRLRFDATHAEEFPPACGVEGESGSFNVATLSRLLASTHFAISHDETRPHVNSLLVTFDGATVQAVSTNGHMVAVAEGTLANPGTLSRKWMIPRRAVMALRRLCAVPDGATSIGVTVSPTHARFQRGLTSITTRMVDASFPPWLQVVPRSFKVRVEVPRAALISALCAAAMANTSHAVKLRRWRPVTRRGAFTPSSEAAMVRLKVEGGKMTVECPYGGGAAVVKVACRKTWAIGLSSVYLLNSLGALSGETAIIEGNDLLDCVRVSGPGGAAQFIIMPARV